jgi:hypothetical protein
MDNNLRYHFLLQLSSDKTSSIWLVISTKTKREYTIKVEERNGFRKFKFLGRINYDS